MSFTPDQRAALDASEELFRRNREAPPEARKIAARMQAEVDAEHAREFPPYEQLRAERDALRAENERMQKQLDTPMVCEFCSWQDQTGLKKHKPGECSMYVEYQCPCEDPTHA